MKKTIAVLPGDGIGPEIIDAALKVLTSIEKKFNHSFDYQHLPVGAAAVDEGLDPLPQETVDACLSSDAVLLGTIGDPGKYDDKHILTSLLDIRKKLGLYANLRPILTFPTLYHKSPLKESIVEDVDFIVVRELTGGIYFGKPRERRDNGNTAIDTCVYTREEIDRITRKGFDIAMNRKKKATVVDKRNVLETSKLWREVVDEVVKDYPEIELEYLLIDNAAMQIIKRPKDFDVIITTNMFGDILTDEASMITGSIGMLPSASIGEKTSLYEPIHGSYPKAAGKNTANPIGTILSAAMMLEYSFDMKEEAESIRVAVISLLDEGKGTKDIVTNNSLSTSEVGEEVASKI